MKTISHSFLLLLIVCALSAQKYRIKQTYKLPFTPNKIDTLSNQALALTQDGIIQIISGQNLTQTIQRLDINTNPNTLRTIGYLIYFLDKGQIYSTLSFPNSHLRSIAYPFPSTSSQNLFQMKQIGNSQIIPATGGQDLLQIDITQYNISLNYNSRISSSSMSNIVAHSDGYYYYARLEGTEIVVYRNFTTLRAVAVVFSFSTSISNPSRSVQSLQMFEGNNLTTFVISWSDPSLVNPSIIYTYTLDNDIIKTSRNYSCFFTRSKARSPTDIILLGYYDAYSLNMNTLPQAVYERSLTNTLFFDSFSSDGVFALTIDSRVIVNKYYSLSYLYKYNSTISNYSLSTNLITNETGSAIRGSTFLGNGNYLILQQKSQNTSSNNPQISVFNLATLSYTNNLIQSNPDISNYIHYCSPSASSSLLIISNNTNTFELHHYTITNDTSYDLLDSIQIPYDPTASMRNISCVGNNQLVFIEKLNSSDWSYQLFEINPNGTLLSKLSLTRTIESIGIYGIASFFSDSFLIQDQIDQDVPHLYDYNFNEIATPLDSGIKYKDIVEHSPTSMVLYNPVEKNYQYYLYSSNQFLYQGSYSSVDNRNNQIKSVILIQSLKKLYVTYTTNATIFDLNIPHLQRIGTLKDPALNPIKLDRPRFSTQNGDLKLFGSKKNSIYRFGISNTSNTVNYEESISLDITPVSIRLSSDQSKIVVTKVSPKSILEPIYIVEVYESMSLSSLKFMTTLTDIQSTQSIVDTDYTTRDSIILAGKLSQNTDGRIYLHFYSNNQYKIQTSPQLTTITTFGIGKNWIAYSGNDLVTQSVSTSVYYHIVDTIDNISKIDIGCIVANLEISLNEEQFLGYCQNGSYFVFNRISQSLKKSGTVVTQAKFLNDTFIIINEGGILTIIDTTKLLSNQQQNYYNSLNLAAASTITAIDQTKQIIASASQSSITISDFSNNLIDTFSLPQGYTAVSLSFNSKNDLYISTNSQTLFLWTSTGCSPNQILIGSYCTCKATFLNQSGLCICPNNLVLTSGYCGCSVGYYEANFNCQQCSSFCKSCTDNACDEYSVLFFILVIGGPLILLIVGVIVFIKVKKAKKTQDSQVSTDNLGGQESKRSGSDTKRSGKNRLIE